jgi:hypothetical protein
MNTQTLSGSNHAERGHNPNALFYAGVFCAVLGALVALEVVAAWAFQMIIRLLTNQV